MFFPAALRRCEHFGLFAPILALGIAYLAQWCWLALSRHDVGRWRRYEQHKIGMSTNGRPPVPCWILVHWRGAKYLSTWGSRWAIGNCFECSAGDVHRVGLLVWFPTGVPTLGLSRQW